MKNQKRHTKLIILILTVILITGIPGISAFSVSQENEPAFYDIISPYENVDWNAFGQFKAALHVHSTKSDGKNTQAEMIKEHYRKGFDIVSFNDHDFLTAGWEETGLSRKIIGLPDTNEQSETEHINTYWAPFNNTSRGRMSNIEKMNETFGIAENLSGISIINHLGRYTGGDAADFDAGAAASSDPETVEKYVNFFMTYPSLVGMEIINRLDDYSRSDRILWDNILKQTMPQGRPVWGTSTDDSHSLQEVGYSYTIMLLPELTVSAVRKALETGSFYAVSAVARREGVNATYPNGRAMKDLGGDDSTKYLLNNSFPTITNITVDGNNIKISGSDYDVIEWIASGAVISTGNTLDVGEFAGLIKHNYVRAQLKSNHGIAFTQPFGIFETEDHKEEITPPFDTPPEPDDEAIEETTYVEIEENDIPDEDSDFQMIIDLLHEKGPFITILITVLPIVVIILAIRIMKMKKK